MRLPVTPPITSFSFILLRDVAANTQILFSDLGWLNTPGRFQGRRGDGTCASSGFTDTGTRTDGVIRWTANQAYPAGTQVHVVCRTNLSASVGTVTGVTPTVNSATSYLQLGSAGDQIFAYQGSEASPSFVAAISLSRNWDAANSLTNPCELTSAKSELPTSLASVGLAIFSATDDQYAAIYTGSLVITQSAATLRTALLNPANWRRSPAVDGVDQLPPNTYTPAALPNFIIDNTPPRHADYGPAHQPNQQQHGGIFVYGYRQQHHREF